MRMRKLCGVVSVVLALGSGCAEQPGKKKDDEKSKDGKDAKKDGKDGKTEAKVEPPK